MPNKSLFPHLPAVRTDGIACFHPDIAHAAEDFPDDGHERLIALEDGNFWFEGRNQVIRHLVDVFMPQRSPCRFLEIGCGTGFVLRMLAGLPDYQVAGAEVHLAGAKLAAKRVPQAEVVQLDALRMDFTAAFDGIGVFDVIEHIQDDVKVLNSIRQALTPEGRCFITVPQHPWLWSPQDDLSGHKRRYTRATLRKNLAAAGLETVFISSYCFTLMPFFIASRLLKRSHDAMAAKEAVLNELTIPHWMNRLFTLLVGIDVALTRRNVSLPFGGSLIAVARPV